MDQTPLPFSLASQSTLEMRGTRSVTIRQSGNNKTRATASLAVAADGSKLKPMIIFKGEPRGTIATRELPMELQLFCFWTISDVTIPTL
ncbi:hypothetical protein IV203_018970 [Nitzschia inconspicua]|uniref:Uncharacterized protein n=1 Tax=Nitzschia inconspicua TaxID=303405 RepID=A0A9K3K6D0_9STRA|nr:hypothetical protein IV203_018970 [Nitzschia inconspicua]